MIVRGSLRVFGLVEPKTTNARRCWWDRILSRFHQHTSRCPTSLNLIRGTRRLVLIGERNQPLAAHTLRTSTTKTSTFNVPPPFREFKPAFEHRRMTYRATDMSHDRSRYAIRARMSVQENFRKPGGILHVWIGLA